MCLIPASQSAVSRDRVWQVSLDLHIRPIYLRTLEYAEDLTLFQRNE